MNLCISRDNLTYELSVTCQVDIGIRGLLPPQRELETELLQRLLAQLETDGFFEQMATTMAEIKQHVDDRYDTDDLHTLYLDLEADNDDVPF